MEKEPRLHVLRKEELDTHDMYELAFAHNYSPESRSSASFWHSDSLYLADEPWGIGVLTEAISAVFPHSAFNWFGPNRVTLKAWAQIEALTLSAHPGENDVEDFFSTVRCWLEEGNHGADFFWILGP